MSQEGGESSGVVENPAEDVVKQEENEQLDSSPMVDSRNPVQENGYHDGNEDSSSHDELVQMVAELGFQNEYLKSQYEGLKTVILDSDGPDQEKAQSHDDSVLGGDVRQMLEEIKSLKTELIEERQTRGAAEEALKHLRAAHSDADLKVQELSTKYAEAQQKMDQEIKERDEKYSELDSKFNRLHKRAKQRIQEVQKEKDDIEAQLSEVKSKAELASSQLSALQQELERTRQHANEALKAMDTERQQLRSTNNKLRDNIEELRHSLIPKENALEAMQHSMQEKEQLLEDMRGLLQVADEKRLASIAELSLKHQKQVENFEAQMADFLSERSRATETISSLRALIVEKDTKIAEMDAASSGEAARLRAAMEKLKGELSHLKNEHEKEKGDLEAVLQSLRSNLEISENHRVHAEVEAASLRSQLESELSVQSQLLASKDAELGEAKEKINRIEHDFASYKVRAHALLQKKDSELAAVTNNDQFKSLEEALKDAEREILLISAEKDKASQDLNEALTNSEKEISSR
ncbi:Protein GRIP [Striga hermonthica]|uniref:Protein GRIP n=1 Tax=Striga hermonthica TaxID=68872 RepID=A0A9N7N3P7_STRHE|nr:Protein GRIP [Striga hermonthica]